MNQNWYYILYHRIIMSQLRREYLNFSITNYDLMYQRWWINVRDIHNCALHFNYTAYEPFASKHCLDSYITIQMNPYFYLHETEIPWTRSECPWIISVTYRELFEYIVCQYRTRCMLIAIMPALYDELLQYCDL